jgi:phosphatidylinositol 4-kinase
LVVGITQDLIELEAQVQAILKRASSHNLSVEAIRGDLANGVPSQASHARSISTPQAVFLATTYRLESLRAQAGAIAPLFLYFGVPALSGDSPIAETLKSIGDKVGYSEAISGLSSRLTSIPAGPFGLHGANRTAGSAPCDGQLRVRPGSVDPASDDEQFGEHAQHCAAIPRQHPGEFPLARLQPGRCHRHARAPYGSSPSMSRRVHRRGAFACFCDVWALLKCASQYTPSFEFHSTRGNFTITLSDDYPLRNRILRNLHEHVRSWLKKGITRSPLEMQGLLQEYVDVTSDGYRMQMLNDDEMGKSVALDLVKTPPANGKYGALWPRRLALASRSLMRVHTASLPAWGNWNADASTAFARTFAAKSFFGGEAQRGGEC